MERKHVGLILCEQFRERKHKSEKTVQGQCEITDPYSKLVYLNLALLVVYTSNVEGFWKVLDEINITRRFWKFINK